jgi:hypothetical protein
VKTKIALVFLAGFLAVSSVAAAHQLPYPTARKFTKAWVQEACDERGPSCLTWRVTKCGRINVHRVDCIAAIRFRDGSACVFILENRLKPNNFVHQRRRSTKCG